MNRDDIIRLAEQAGVHEGGAANWVNGNRWEQFAFLVAAAEREKFCSDLRALHDVYSLQSVSTIRERGAP